MKLPIFRFLLALLSFLLPFVALRADAAPFVSAELHKPYSRLFFLGRTRNVNDYARVDLEPLTHGARCEVTLTFESRRRNHLVKQTVMNIGESYVSGVKFNAAPLVGRRRKELFVSLVEGAVTTRVFSYASGKLKTLYQNRGGRVVVFLWPEQGGGHVLVENWPLLQWEDCADQIGGGATYIGPGSYATDGYVRRTLRWKNQRFVAKESQAQRRGVNDALRRLRKDR